MTYWSRAYVDPNAEAQADELDSGDRTTVIGNQPLALVKSLAKRSVGALLLTTVQSCAHHGDQWWLRSR